MSEFMALDAKSPATLGAVVEAVARLSTLSEAQLLELVSAGKLSQAFPFQPAGGRTLPAETLAEDELVEASAMPLNAMQRDSLVASSLPAGNARKPRRRRISGLGTPK